MKIQKFVELKDLRVTDKGPGTIEGYRAVFSVDHGGDLIVPGAFRESIPEFLSSGFTAESHDWKFSNAIGFPVDAREDDYGLFVVSQFHSTPDAQAVRTKAKERMKAGKKVGFSFGYSVEEYDYIDKHKYETELPRYVKAADLSYNLNMARRFPQVRLLKKVKMVEDSLVTKGMNPQAEATGVKGFSHYSPGTLKSAAQLRYETLHREFKEIAERAEFLILKDDIERSHERLLALKRRGY